MGHKQHCNAVLLLEVGEQSEYLRLYGDVQCRNGFVGDDEVGLGGNGATYGDALPLTPRKFVRILFCKRAGKPNVIHENSYGRSKISAVDQVVQE